MSQDTDQEIRRERFEDRQREAKLKAPTVHMVRAGLKPPTLCGRSARGTVACTDVLKNVTCARCRRTAERYASADRRIALERALAYLLFRVGNRDELGEELLAIKKLLPFDASASSAIAKGEQLFTEDYEQALRRAFL